MKNKNIFILIFTLLMLLISFSIFIYSNDYYHALAQCNIALTSDEKVSVTIKKDSITFNPAVPSETGMVFYPGGKVEYTAYAPLMRRLAEKGVTCVLVHMPLNLAVLSPNKADQALKHYPEIKNWYICGHSLGGAIASSYAAKHPSAFNGIIFLGAYASSNLSNTSINMLSLYGSEDNVLNRENLEKTKTNNPSNVKYYEITGGNHAYFGLYGEQNGDGLATITTEEQQTKTVDEIMHFVNQEQK
jgi:hypothetical protein